MASLSYDGDIVNSSVQNMSNAAANFTNLVGAMQNATNRIVSARGFNEYIGGITTDSFSSQVTDCQTAGEAIINEIRQSQVKILSYSQDEGDIKAFLDSLDRLDYKKIDLSAIEDHIGLDRKAGNFFKGLVGDVGAGLFGFGEGLVEFGETGADLLATGFTSAASLFTLEYDKLNGTNVTGEMWDNTRAFVSTKHSENLFNSIYANTDVGRFIKNNAYGFDTVRNVSKGLGYMTGMIGLNVATGGLASGAGAVGSVGATQLAATAGMLGVASGAEQAWSEGAGTTKGLAYGAANGVWEAAQWYAGAKINQLGGVGDQVEKIAGGIFKGGRVGATTRVALDAVDGGLEGFVQPGLSMIYKDYGQGSAIDNYKKAFEEAGGWANVGTNAAMGGFMSMIGEVTDARKLLKEANKANTNIEGEAAALAGAAGSSKEIFESDGSLSKSLREANNEMDRGLKETLGGDPDSIRRTAQEYNAMELKQQQEDALNNFFREKQKMNPEKNMQEIIEEARISGEVDDFKKASVLFRNDPELEKASLGDGSSHRYVTDQDELGLFDRVNRRAREFFTGSNGSDRVFEHVDADTQSRVVRDINQQIRNNGSATISVTSTKELTSSMFDNVDDLSKLKVKIDGGFSDLDGNFKSKYNADRYQKRITYTGYEAASILRRMEQLESRIDMSLPTTERAKQIYQIVADEYGYSTRSLDVEGGHQVSASLRGMTANNMMGEEGLVCAGYSQLYKELCNRAGVKCEYISGTAVLGNGSTGRHAWNVIFDDNGEQIPVDVTWKSSSGREWFGASDVFASTHYADPDEVFRDYAPRPQRQTPQVQSARVQAQQGNNSSVSYIVSTMDDTHGHGSGNYGLLRYLGTRMDNSITSTGGARNMLRSLSDEDITNYIKGLDDRTRVDTVMRYIKNQVFDKYGDVRGQSFFNDFLTYGNPTAITRDNGARKIATEFLSFDDIMDYARRVL